MKLMKRRMKMKITKKIGRKVKVMGANKNSQYLSLKRRLLYL